MTAAEKLQKFTATYNRNIISLEKKYDSITMNGMIKLIAEYKQDFPHIRYLSEVIEIMAKKATIAETN